MRFNYWDLGHQHRGSVVEVQMAGNAANVRLLDSSNFSAYKAGRRHSYVGGHVKRSPVRLQIPRSGRWYVAIDYGGFAGRGRASVQVLPGALPPLRERSTSSLDSIRENVEALRIDDGGAEMKREWDVFISHATEDKEQVVSPLAAALGARGLRVWYDEFELRIGSNLRRAIDEGLAGSRFGIVVLSPAFFSKNWPQYELDGLVIRQVSGEQVILPILHGLTIGDVAAKSPSLANVVARSTSDMSVDMIAAEIAEVISPPVAT